LLTPDQRGARASERSLDLEARCLIALASDCGTVSAQTVRANFVCWRPFHKVGVTAARVAATCETQPEIPPAPE
jgi:hypothetical protein